MRLILERLSIPNDHIYARDSVKLGFVDWVFVIYEMFYLDLTDSHSVNNGKYLWVDWDWDWNSKAMRVRNRGYKVSQKFLEIARGLRLDKVLVVSGGDE